MNKDKNKLGRKKRNREKTNLLDNSKEKTEKKSITSKNSHNQKKPSKFEKNKQETNLIKDLVISRKTNTYFKK